MHSLTVTRLGRSTAYWCEFCDERAAVVVSAGLRAVPLCAVHQTEVVRLLTASAPADRHVID